MPMNLDDVTTALRIFFLKFLGRGFFFCSILVRGLHSCIITFDTVERL